MADATAKICETAAYCFPVTSKGQGPMDRRGVSLPLQRDPQPRRDVRCGDLRDRRTPVAEKPRQALVSGHNGSRSARKQAL